jgi:hypothetical protein
MSGAIIPVILRRFGADPATGSRSRTWWLWLVLVPGVALGGCESDAEKCARLQREAASVWGAYAAVLDRGSVRALSAYEAAKAKAAAVEQGLVDSARKQADALHDRQSSAWWRTVNAAQQTLCSKDAQCMEVKADMAQAEQTRRELAGRLAAVRAAIAAATTAAAETARAQEAERAARAVDDDFDRPEIKPARAASAAAHEACAELGR